MAIFMIGYDLHAGQNYKNLEDAIENLSIGDPWHCLDSTWLIQTNLNAAEIRSALRPHIKADDRLLIMRYQRTTLVSTIDAAWFGFDKPCEDWLSENL